MYAHKHTKDINSKNIRSHKTITHKDGQKKCFSRRPPHNPPKGSKTGSESGSENNNNDQNKHLKSI